MVVWVQGPEDAGEQRTQASVLVRQSVVRNVLKDVDGKRQSHIRVQARAKSTDLTLNISWGFFKLTSFIRGFSLVV